jgi:hypothetical protein
MKIDSVRSLKLELRRDILAGLVTQDVQRRRLGVRAVPYRGTIQPKTVALGIAKHSSSTSEYQLAVRIQHPLLWNSPEVDSICKKAANEVDLRLIGSIRPLRNSVYQGIRRPLILGCSVGETQITAGTLGAFAQDRITGKVQILSNNHVLANENQAKIGDSILQPGRFDNGVAPANVVASLTRFVPLLWGKPNSVDCAVASIDGDVNFDPSSLHNGQRLAGGRTSSFNGSETVYKIGRTTGYTKGIVTAIEVDNITVSYDHGTAVFDSQIEIQGTGKGPFAAGGDSGALAFDSDNDAFGIVFGGTEQGADNRMGLTYVNQLDPILQHLDVDLIY